MSGLKVLRLTAVAVLLLGVTVLNAQITIDWNEIPHRIGDSLRFKAADGVVTIDVGSPGGPETWAFDTIYPGFVVPVELVDKNTTPFESVFPTADFAWMVDYEDSLWGIEYSFRTHSTTQTEILGLGFEMPGTTWTMIYTPPSVALVYPAEFGTSWETSFAWTDTLDSLSWIVFEHQCKRLVDAWGSVTIPPGTYPCLRMASLDSSITTTYMNGVPISTDTNAFRWYNWLVEGLGCVASARVADTSSSFTEAYCFSVLVWPRAGGVAESGPGRIASRLNALPNPFSGLTTIDFNVGKPGHAAIRIHSRTGRAVRTLIDDIRPAGTHTVHWNGTDDLGNKVAPGIYFCTLVSDRTSTSRKLILME